MKTNIGPIDRTIRILIGLSVLATGYLLDSWWGLVGVIPILTAIVRFCPAYLPLGINTCRSAPDKK